MKAIIIILLCVISSKGFTQITVNNDLNKYVGTWRYNIGLDTFEITLNKQIKQSKYEVIVGWHKFVKNGTVIQSSYQFIGRDINVDFNSNSLDFKTTISGFTYPNGPNRLNFIRFWNLSEHQNYEAYFTLLPNSTTQGVLRITNRTGIKYIDHNGTISTIPKWPRNITLTKL